MPQLRGNEPILGLNKSLRFSIALSTCFCWIEGARGKAVVVAVSFYSPFEQIVKKLNFAV
jgi:hypothetical protein